MAKITPTTILGAYASTSELNANFAALAAEFEKVVSRDGEAPSEMTADFDMGGHDILNGGTISADSLTLDGNNIEDGGYITVPPAYTHASSQDVTGLTTHSFVIPDDVEEIIVGFNNLDFGAISYLTASDSVGDLTVYKGSPVTQEYPTHSMGSLTSTIPIGNDITLTDLLYGHFVFHKQSDTFWTFNGMIGTSNNQTNHGAFGGFDLNASSYLDAITIASTVAFDSGVVYCKYLF